MRSDFIILYHGREGSSPIIDSLSRHRSIYVPVFEDLDEANYLATSGRDRCSLTRVFTALFSRNGSKFLSGQLPDFSPEQCAVANAVGFKWRLWGDAGALSQVFEEGVVTLFVLLRRREVDRSFSEYFTNQVLDGRLGFEKDQAGNIHPQFRLAGASPEQYQEYIDRMRQLRFEIEPQRIANMLKTSVRRKREFLTRLSDYVRVGTEVRILYYEDFVANRRRFFADFLSILDLPFDDAVLDSRGRKASPDFREVVENYDQVLESEAVVRAGRDWGAVMGEFHQFAASRSGNTLLQNTSRSPR